MNLSSTSQDHHLSSIELIRIYFSLYCIMYLSGVIYLFFFFFLVIGNNSSVFAVVIFCVKVKDVQQSALRQPATIAMTVLTIMA